MQAGADAHGFQFFHQRIAADSAGRFIHANNKQVPGVLVFPFRYRQRLKRRIRQLAQIALGNLATTLVLAWTSLSSCTSASAALISARLYLKPGESPPPAAPDHASDGRRHRRQDRGISGYGMRGMPAHRHRSRSVRLLAQVIFLMA